MTPITFQSEKRLKGKVVFLSASKPSRRFDVFPLVRDTALEIEEAAVSLARAVFSEEGRLVFGAHPSISPLIASVAAEYFPADWGRVQGSEAPRPVEIYQSKAFRNVIPESTKALASLGYAKLTETDAIGEQYSDEIRGQEQCLNALEHMRRRMLKETQPCAMVAIGGMEGVLREAHLFLEIAAGSVYALRTTGGASRFLAKYLNDNLLKEPHPISAGTSRGRVKIVEDEFGLEEGTDAAGKPGELLLAPYSLLMQKMVGRIAREQSGANR